MVRTLTRSTLDRFRAQLTAEHSRLTEILQDLEEDLQTSAMIETTAERKPAPINAEAEAKLFEFEKDFSLGENTRDILAQVKQAKDRLEAACTGCGSDIPVARLRARPYTTLRLEDAARL